MLPKSHLISPNNPNKQSHGERVKTHECAVDSPFRFDKTWTNCETTLLCSQVTVVTSIDNNKTRNRLKTDQTGRCELPGIITFVQPVWIRLSGDIKRHDGELLVKPTRKRQGKVMREKMRIVALGGRKIARRAVIYK